MHFLKNLDFSGFNCFTINIEYDFARKKFKSNDKWQYNIKFLTFTSELITDNNFVF